jgi:hypothetical protein
VNLEKLVKTDVVFGSSSIYRDSERPYSDCGRSDAAQFGLIFGAALCIIPSRNPAGRPGRQHQTTRSIVAGF